MKGTLSDVWGKHRRKLVKALHRSDRDRFDALVLDLLDLALHGQPPTAPWHPTIMRIGVDTALTLAKEAPPDPELLAAAVALPWFDNGLLGPRSPLSARGRPLDWTAAMVLAMAPAGLRGEIENDGYLRQLAALPPLLRATAILERAFAGAAQQGPGMPLGPALAFTDAEVAALSTGIPPKLLPPGGLPPGPLPEPLPPPVGSPAEAIELVREHAKEPFGSYRLFVEGDPGFLVTGTELVYQVRWDVPLDQIITIGGPISYPGDTETIRYDQPGWIVDRVTREVHPVDLAGSTLERYVSARRVFPLPPGWRIEGRGPIPEGLAAMLPVSAVATVQPMLGEAIARYTAALATEAWPDYLVAWRIACETVNSLLTAGYGDPDTLTAGLLAAQGPAPTDTVVGEASPLWHTLAGQYALAARPAPDETDGPGAARRAARLASASPEVRAIAVANAEARLTVETALFGIPPASREAELTALS